MNEVNEVTEVNEKLFCCMTVYVRTISGKTISIECDKRQSTTRIKDEIERRTKIPKALQHIVNQGKTLSEEKTIDECSREECNNSRDDLETARWDERR